MQDELTLKGRGASGDGWQHWGQCMKTEQLKAQVGMLKHHSCRKLMWHPLECLEGTATCVGELRLQSIASWRGTDANWHEVAHGCAGEAKLSSAVFEPVFAGRGRVLWSRSNGKHSTEKQTSMFFLFFSAISTQSMDSKVFSYENLFCAFFSHSFSDS